MYYSYTIKATHEDYNVSLVGLVADNDSEALELALEHYRENRYYLKPITKLEVVKKDGTFTTEIKMTIFKKAFIEEALSFEKDSYGYAAYEALEQVMNDEDIIKAINVCPNETAVLNMVEYAVDHYIQ